MPPTCRLFAAFAAFAMVAAAPPPVASLAYTPDSKLLAAGAGRDVTIIDAAGGEVVGKIDTLPGPVTALAYSPDGRRLALCAGTPGKAAELRVYPVTGGLPTSVPSFARPVHKDAVYGLAFSPNGQIIATASYDRTVTLWDVRDGSERHVLKDHSDSVYGVAFSADGKLLASAAADRAVKVWDVATGKRLYSLGEATDWLYAAAFSPDGRTLAAAGVDRSLRVWEVSATEGRLVRTAFAHEGPVNRLVYSADGRTLYSLSEDGTAKGWDAATLTERFHSDKMPDTPLSLALRPDGRQLAVGRYDGAVVLLDAATGKVQSQPLPAKPKPPTVAKASPDAGPRGRTVRVTLTGQSLQSVTDVAADVPGTVARLRPDGVTPTRLDLDLTLPPTLPAGPIKLTARSPAGAASVAFTVDLFPAVPARAAADAPSTGEPMTLDATIVGAIERVGDVDFFRFDVKAGQPVGVQASVPAGSKLEPVLQWLAPDGRVLAESNNGLLGVTCPGAGTCTLGVRDRDYRGGAGYSYRLHVGTVPVATGVAPLGLRRGTAREFQVAGVFLDAPNSTVAAPAEAKPGAKLPVPVTSPRGPVLGAPTVVVGEFPETVDPAAELPVPGTANGRIDQHGTHQEWSFAATKGQRLVVEVMARRIGSALDSVIEVFDAHGRPVPRAVLRCVTRQFVTFRDHDSALPGIRLEAWNDLAIDDLILIGNEVVRIEALPKNPDDDCRFYSVNNQRLAFLDTSPEFHANGSPLYKVTVHPPGTTFPPNGLPLVPLYFRNDDGGPGYGKDSRLFFDAPADGTYRVRVSDSRGLGGDRHDYRLTVRPPRPDFTVSLSPAAPRVWKGGAVPVTVTVTRQDGYAGPVAVRLDGLPPGLHSAPSEVEAEQFTTTLAVWADADAKAPPDGTKLRLVGRAVIDGKAVEHDAVGGKPSVVEPGDIVTTTGQSAVAIKPGQETTLDVAVERRNGFKGRIPVEVRGLPHGVRVLDIGLNGILITERESARRVVLYAEPWVKPGAHPIVVLANHEGKQTAHGARPVTLTVVGAAAAGGAR